MFTSIMRQSLVIGCILMGFLRRRNKDCSVGVVWGVYEKTGCLGGGVLGLDMGDFLDLNLVKIGWDCFGGSVRGGVWKSGSSGSKSLSDCESQTMQGNWIGGGFVIVGD